MINYENWEIFFYMTPEDVGDIPELYLQAVNDFERDLSIKKIYQDLNISTEEIRNKLHDCRCIIRYNEIDAKIKTKCQELNITSEYLKSRVDLYLSIIKDYDLEKFLLETNFKVMNELKEQKQYERNIGIRTKLVEIAQYLELSLEEVKEIPKLYECAVKKYESSLMN